MKDRKRGMFYESKRYAVFLCCFFFMPDCYSKKEIYTYLETENIKELENISANHILLINRNDNKILYEKNSEEEIVQPV